MILTLSASPLDKAAGDTLSERAAAVVESDIVSGALEILNGDQTFIAEAGALVPTLDPRRFTLDTVDDAHRAIGDGTAKGKLVVEID